MTSKHFVIIFLQVEISKIMRQGIEEMIQHEKNQDKPPKVYTYEKAVERYLLMNVFINFYIMTVINIFLVAVIHVDYV